MKNRDALDISFYILAAILFVVSGVVLWRFFHYVGIDYHCGNPIDMAATGQVGDFIGGVVGTIFAFIGTIFVFLTLRAQRQQMQKSHFDGVFETLLEQYRQSVSEMKVVHEDISIPGKKHKYEGRQVFLPILEDFNILYGEVAEALLALLKKEHPKKRYLTREECQEAVSVAYGYMFYSVGEYSKSYEKTLGFSQGQIAYLVYKNSQHTSLHNLHLNEILSQYYRNLYHMVLFVDKAYYLTKMEKLQYCDIIRSQMSDYEQILLFYNSMTKLGQAWNHPNNQSKWRKMNLIAKYRLVKDCPSYYTYFAFKPNIIYWKERLYWEKKGEVFFTTYFSQIRPIEERIRR